MQDNQAKTESPAAVSSTPLVRLFTVLSSPPTLEVEHLQLREAACAAEYILGNGASKVLITQEPNDQAEPRPAEQPKL